MSSTTKTNGQASANNPKHVQFSKEVIAQFGYQPSDLETNTDLAETIAELISRNTKRCYYCDLDLSEMRGRSRRGHIKSCGKRYHSYRTGEKADFRVHWRRTTPLKRSKNGQFKK